MSLPPSLAGPLGRYLQSVSPAALKMLMASINRERQRGATPSEIETLIINAARKLLRDEDIMPARHSDARRRLFAPLEPFLMDGMGLKKQAARIERRSLAGIWTWLERDLLPGSFSGLVSEIDAAIDAGDDDHATSLADAVRGEAVAAIRAAIDEAGDAEHARMRLAAQAGGGNCLDDARDFADIVGYRSALQLLEDRLPHRVADLNQMHLSRCTELLEAAVRAEPSLRAHAVALLMRRLDKPVQIVRLAIQDAGNDDARRLKESKYAVAGDLILYDIQHAARASAQMLKSRSSADEIWVRLFDFYTLAHGLRVEAELPRDSAWTTIIGRSSRVIADRLGPIVSAAPRLTKAALLPRGGALISAPDEADLADAEYAIAMLQQTKSFVSELPLNDLLSRTVKELDHYLTTIGDSIVERVRDARAGQRSDAEAMLHGVVRLTRLAMGDEMAELLHRAGRTALGSPSEPRSAAG